MKIGDVSRQRRFADPARQRWYAHYRSVRFALRMRQGTGERTLECILSSTLVLRAGRFGGG